MTREFLLTRCATIVLAWAALAAPCGALPEPHGAPTPADRIAAFSTLLDAVRYYHPSDEVAALADWNLFSLEAAERVVGAGAPSDLASALEQAFCEVAPTLRIGAPGQAPPLPEALLPSGGGEREIVLWRHFGPGIPQRRQTTFRSERLGSSSAARFATIAQSLPASALRGKRVRFEALARMSAAAPETVAPEDGELGASSSDRAQLFLRVDRSGGQRGFFDSMDDRPIRTDDWRRYTIEGEIDADAEQIVLGAVLFGRGRLFLDEVEITVLPSAGPTPMLANRRFDDGLVDQQPPGWTFPYEAIREGYRFVHRRGRVCRQGDCAEVVADPAARLSFAPPGQRTEIDLGAGLVAYLPTRLYRDATGTLPHKSPAGTLAAATPPGRLAERTAILASLWGALAHFNPYLTAIREDWAAALRRAAADPGLHGDEPSFRRTLERLLAGSGDLAAEVWAPDEVEPHQPAIEWRWLEDRLVITQAPPASGLRRGDVVTALDGQPTRERLEEMETRTAGSTPAARSARALARLLGGARGSVLRLGLESSAGAGETRLARDQPADLYIAIERPAVEEIEPGTWYLDLRRLEDEQLAAALPRIEGAQRLVVDARGALSSGTRLLAHLGDRELPSANWQMSVTSEPFQRDARPVSTFWTVPPQAPRWQARVAFLIDERASAYSETVLGIVEAFRLGELVGTPTAGNNGNVAFVELPGGYGASFTSLRVLKHDTTPLQGVGIQPTREVRPTLAGIAAGRDEVLEAALARLR